MGFAHRASGPYPKSFGKADDWIRKMKLPRARHLSVFASSRENTF
jgi:hypothetical protein